MKIHQLINQLQEFNPEHEVYVYLIDTRSEEVKSLLPISGTRAVKGIISTTSPALKRDHISIYTDIGGD